MTIYKESPYRTMLAPTGQAVTNWRLWPLVSLILGCLAIGLLTNQLRNTSHLASSSNKEWLAIWETKGVSIGDDEPLHHANGFNGIDLDQWNTLITTIIKSEGRERFQPNDTVIDFGCGAGAFLQTLALLQSSLSLFGLDYSAPLVDLARHRVGNDQPGHFWRADIRNVGFLPSEEFDHAVSFSVFFYLDSLADVLAAWGEMARVTKVNGSVIVAEVSDKAMEEEAEELRNGKSEYEKKKKEGQKAAGGTPDHLYIAKSLFLDNAEKFGLRIDKILDERAMTPDLSYYGPAAYRYTVYATKVAPVKD